MYRGNAPGQFNGNRMPAGKEYNVAYGIPHPNQPQMRGQVMQGHSVQRFQNQNYGTPTSQVQYQAQQPTGYHTDPYSYGSSKMVGDVPRSFSGVTQTTMSSGISYGASGMQVRPTGAYPGGSGPEVSVASDSGLGMQQFRQTKPQGWPAKPTSDMNMMHYGQGDPTASRVYNGSQYMSGVTAMQPGTAQAQPDPNNPHLRHPMQSPSYSENKSGPSLGSSAQPYQGQMSSMPSQFQQRPGISSTTPSSMYMQQQYVSQTRNSFAGQQAQLSSELQQGSKMPGQFDESQMLVQQQQQQQQQNTLHQQATMKQGQIYRPKAPSSAGSISQTGHPQQQLMGVPSNPLRQALSPRHNSPLSPPMRGTMGSRPTVPPASPQMQVARTTPQYPAPQASPLHQANPMSPSSRLPSYSPRQQMSSGYMMQGQMPSGYRPNVTPSRVPAPRNEQSNRGFMSPSHMMSPPPVSPLQNISQSQSNRMPTPFNGDSSMQQYYNQTGRYPPSWQGSKPQTAATGRVVPSSPATVTRQPLMQQMQRPMFGTPQQQSQQQQQQLQQSFNNSQYNQIPNASSSNENNLQQTLSTPTATPSRRSSILPSTASTSVALTAPSDFDADFNLDSILSDAMDTTGSFMQQLQEVVPSSASLVDPIKLSPVPQSSSNEVLAVSGIKTVAAKPPQLVMSQTKPALMQVSNNAVAINTSTPIKNTYNSVLESNHNSSGDSKLDSGEITLETTEQDLLKTTSDITIPLTETEGTNLPVQPNNFANELNDTEKSMLRPTVSQSPLVPNSTTSTGPTNENAPVKSTPSEASNSEKFDLVSSLSTDMIDNAGTNDPSTISQGMGSQQTALSQQTLPSGHSTLFSQGILPNSTLASYPSSMPADGLGDRPSVATGRRISMGPPVQVSTRPDGQPSNIRPMGQHLPQGDQPRPLPIGSAGQRNMSPSGQPSIILGSQQNSMLGGQQPVGAIVPTGLSSGGQPTAAQDAQQSGPPSIGRSSTPSSGAPNIVLGGTSSVGSIGQPGNVSSGQPGSMQGGVSSSTPSTHLGHHGQPHGMLRPRVTSEGTYGPMHQTRMGMPPRIPQASGSQVPRMHAHDGSAVRQLGPHPYPPHMHPRFQQHPHPSYGYGPRPQSTAGPYPAASATPQHARPPYGQGGPRVPRGPHPGYMGGRPPFQPLHPSQQQHLQQQLQGLRHEAQQLQGQLQCAQQEEAETKPDPSTPMEQHPRSEQIRGRLMDIDRSIKQIMMQLHGGQPHHGPPPQAMQEPNHLMGQRSVGPQDGENGNKSADDSLTLGGKKKRARKPKTKSEGEEGKKPPKKKKKKDVDGELAVGEKKKKKKVKKDKILSGFTDTDTMDGADGDSNDKAILDVASDPFTKDEDATVDDFLADIEDSEISNTIQDKKKVDRKKKRPVATVVKPKKKRKRGYDSSDEMNATDILQSTPPPSPEDSLIEKRRSGRNVKRKRYVESVDLPFSGGEDNSDTQAHEPKKSQQIVELNEMTEAEDVMIVDKILFHRKRKRRVKCRSESKEETQKAGDSVTEESNELSPKPKEPDVPEVDVDSTPAPNDVKCETEPAEAQNGPMLSPTSLKNPRIRKFSMGVDKEEEEEVEDEKAEDEYYVKYKNYSYLHCEWKTKDEIEDKRFDQKLKRYIAKNTSKSGQLIYPELEADELFNPDFVEVDRVLDVTNTDGDSGNETRHFLVKWCSLPYEDSTWEREDDIEKVKIEEFEKRCRYRPPRKISRPPKDTWQRLSEGNTLFCNNNLLRDYQFEGINWLLFNWYNRRNCILADEMGLGKTIQSITFLQKIFDHGIQGPFLVVAPLSTIANWQREFESWTTINAIVYHGSQTSRDMLHTYEWFCRDENLDEIHGSYKMHAVITTYEMIVLDSPHLRDVEWKCLIIDEGHRLKNHTCKLADSLRNMHLDHKVLLTGTPLQNNVEELFALLSFLQPDTFNCQQAFSLEFGNLKDNAQVEKLQELLKPMMLRRLKEDVEKSLAPKQETIIEVELTNIQKKYYRAILERNFEFLAKGTSGGNVPNLMNTMMELRKCCNHPYLIKGAEDKITQEQRSLNKEFNALQAMIQSSGKLVLIDKLLPRLKEGGHKVLVFSQMVRVLDILEDYLVQSGHLYERIDGCIRGNERQMAIDRFSKKGSDRFVFLLCTRAGGLGINLTAADTVIIFDSDWNPQNDLQAQARCHRIGQQKPVKVYRLITRNSYEREMFDKASLKLGLDKAVLQSISGRQDQVTNQPQAPQLSKREVEDLLKRGAYGAVMDDDDAGSKFCEEDIDQILDRRAHTVTLESGEKGSTFSKASFVSAEDRPDISLDDPNFWEKWAKKADLDIDRLNDNKLILEIPRNRKQTRRFGGNSDDKEIFAEIGSDSDDSAEYDSDGAEGHARKSKFRTRAGGSGGGQRKGWGRRDCFRIEKCLLTFGWGRWSVIQQRGRFVGSISATELEDMARAVLMYCLKYYNGDDKIRLFIWDLITPEEIAKKTGIDLRNHEGLATPVPRGRKGKRNKDEAEKPSDEQSKREWASVINLDTFLPDEGFKKHIQHQCNKVILRVRMLYYLRTEILNNITSAIDSATKHDEIEFDVVDKLSDAPAAWWDAACDKSLLIGIYKHGYEKYNLIRADNLLCFLEKAGPPDERALAAEMDVEPDGDESGDPEYKPTRITFNEIEFGQDSPAPGTPNTEPASPATADAAKKKEEDKDTAEPAPAEPKKKEPAAGKDWPSVSDLNTRLRRLITVYQKHYKQIQQRLMNLERRNARSRYSDNSRLDMKRVVQQSRWTRREEADFYRTVSTFGIERDPRSGDFTWRRFRNIARLDRKTDESLRMYYLAFRHMCEQVCRWTDKPGTGDGTGIGLDEEIPNIDVDPITEERASRTLYRIRLLDKVRSNVLVHPKLQKRLKLCQRSAEMPLWWQHGVHDYELLVAMDKHGVTRTEIHTLNDPSLTFLQAMREYEADPMAMKQKVLNEEKTDLENKMKNMKEQQEAREALIKMELTESKESLKKEADLLKDADPKSEKQDEEKDADEKKEETIDGKQVKEEENKEDGSTDDNLKEKVEEVMEVDEPKEVDTESKPNDVDTESKADEETKASEDVEDEKEKNNEDASTIEGSEQKEEDSNDAKKTNENEKTPEKQENPVEDQPQEKTFDVTQGDQVPDDESKPPASSDVKLGHDVKEEASDMRDGADIKRALQMSLRSKTSQPMTSQTPPTPQDVYNVIASSYGGPHHMSPFAINQMNGRWPKDRTLIQRVEQVCFCVINGEWPHTNQSLLPAMSNPTDTASGGFSSSRSQSSTPLSEGRGTPVLPSHTSVLPTGGHDMGGIPGNDKQLQAAMAQLLASNETTPRSSYPSRRGRRKKRADHSAPTSGSPNISFPNQSLPPLDKSLQRKIEQLMAGGNQSYPASSSAAGVFASQSPRSELALSKSSGKPSATNLDNGSGNSSASLLANLRELAKADTKSEQSSSRSRTRPPGGYPHHHSPSSSQSRQKESAKSSSDLLKTSQAQQFMPTPEQIMALTNPSMQQLMQDAAKRGIDPVSAMAAMFPMFPMVDPYQSINVSKADTLPQIPAHLSLPPPGEMEKVLKSMGLPAELAMMPEMWPGLLMPPTSQSKHDQPKDSDSRQDTSSKLSDTSPSILSSSRSDEKRISSLIPDKPFSKKRGVSKLDAMFGLGKATEESPGKSSGGPSGSGKKSRKSKFVSPAMLPPDTRIPVHNNNEGVRLSGKNAPLNKDLADWLKENQGFVVDYQALRQQLDDNGSKKQETEGESDRTSSGSTSSVPPTKDSKQKDIFDEAAVLLKNAKKLVEPHKSEQLEGSSESNRTRDKSKQSDFAVPNPVPSTSPAMSRQSATPTSSSLKQQQQQQLTDMALLQQMNAAAAAGLTDPAAAALFSLPPEILNNLASMPPDVAALIAGGFLPGAMNPDLLAGATGLKPSSRSDDKRRSDSSSPTQSSASGRTSPPPRRHDKNPPTDPSQLTGDERVTVVNITTGKKLSGRHAPELQTLAEYLRSHPDVVVAPDWSTVIRKSKFLPKDLHTRLTPGRSSSPDKYSASSSQQLSSSLPSNAAMAAALGGLPPAMFPGLMQGQGMMSDPMQMMAALQQMPGGQGQMDMKALAASGFPMFPFFGGFPGQDAAAVAAMAALSQTPPPPAKKDQRSSGQDRSSSDGSRGRKSKKHNERHGERSSHRSSSSSTSFKPQSSQSSLPVDPMAEALAALQQSGGLSGLQNPFLAGAGGANPMMFPPMMMGGQSSMFPMDMMNPELLAAQLAAFGGLPNIDPPKLPSSSSASTSTQKREKRRGSSSSSSVSHKPTSSGRSQSRGPTDEQPMDLTQFSGGSSSGKDRQSPDKHKH